MFSIFTNKTTKTAKKAEKKTITKIAKAKVTIAKESFKVILPGDVNSKQSKKEAKFKETIEIIDKLLKKVGYVDNVKADTLRKLIIFLEEDDLVIDKENAMIQWLKNDVGIKVVKKLNVTVSK